MLDGEAYALAMNKKEIYVHIGYGRTGTTWLQNYVFPNLQNIVYHGKTREVFPEWIIDWSYLDRFKLNLEKQKELRKFLYATGDWDKALVSSESFTQTGLIYDQLDRIKKIAPDAKIIVCIRNAVDMVISKYLRMKSAELILEEDKILDICDFSDRPFDLTRRNRLYVNDFNYKNVIPYINEKFGNENVLVLRYESLEKNPISFVESICSFLGVHTPSNLTYEHVNSSTRELYKTINADEKNAISYATKGFDFHPARSNV